MGAFDDLIPKNGDRPLPITNQQRGKLQSQLAGIEGLSNRVAEVDQRFKKDMSATGPAALLEYLPGYIRPQNQRFNDAGRALMGDLAAAFGLSAQQQNTPAELEIRFGPFIPKASDRDPVIKSKIDRLKGIVASQGRQARKGLGMPEPAQSEDDGWKIERVK